MKARGGLWYPDDDETCWRVTEEESDLPDWILDECARAGHGVDCVVHAGANVGAYVRSYASRCNEVHAFEPEARNFECLAFNCGSLENVFLYRAALGLANGRCRVEVCKENCGASYVTLSGPPGVPMFSLDALQIEADLIHLDVEGYELFAIQGAADLIAGRAHMIALEWRSQWSRYGQTNADVLSLLQSLGYRERASYRHEKLFEST